MSNEDSQIHVLTDRTLVGLSVVRSVRKRETVRIEELFDSRGAALAWLFLWRQGTADAQEENSEVRAAAPIRFNCKAAAIESRRQYKSAHLVLSKSQAAIDERSLQKLVLESSPETQIVLASDKERQREFRQRVWA